MAGTARPWRLGGGRHRLDPPCDRHARRHRSAPTAEPGLWPPADATPVGVASLYGGLAAAGCGPAFRGVRAAWRQ